MNSGEKYRHYKGNEYVILAIANHTEREEALVIYQDVNHPEKVWARPKEMWNEQVVLPSGKVVPRFEKIN